MLEELWRYLTWAVGTGVEFEKMATWQVVIRTTVIFLIALVLLRFAKRRFMGDYTAFDILLGFIIGSVMARALTGAAGLLNMVVIVAVLMGLHWLVATISFHWPAFENLVENDPRRLIKDGKINEKAMKKSKISEDDLDQALRAEGNVENPDEVRSAYLERDGSITVVPKEED